MKLLNVVLALGLCVANAGWSAKKMTLKSQTIQAGKSMQIEQVFNGFGCTGGNVSPQLEWTGAPPNTKAFAITMYDPDAPTGSGWWHWTLVNIPPTVTNLPAGASPNSLPEGAMESRTDFGKAGYGGPCPPPGKPHRYIFKVFALKDKMPVDRDASGAMVGFYANQLKLAEASLEVKYGRK